MKKNFLVSACFGLVALMSLTSCAKEVTVDDAKAQANKYSASTVSEKYTSGKITLTCKITDVKGDKVSAAIALSGYKDGTTTTDVSVPSTEMITSAMLVEVNSDLSKNSSSDSGDYYKYSTKFYLDGSALSYKCELSSQITLLNIKTVTESSSSYNYNSDGLFVGSSVSIHEKIGDDNEFRITATSTVEWKTK